jgi:hypothetical protein
LEVLGELPERYGVRVHGYVLMKNHYHVLLETPERNLSRAMQWLNLSYSMWFNRRHGRAGHLFQGRFGSVIVEDDRAFAEMARYIHLNPVRIKGLGLDKRQRRANKVAVLTPAPTVQEVRRRLKMLRSYRWSSYGAYVGTRRAPDWLYQKTVLRACGGARIKEQQEALRRYTEEAIRSGLPESPWERLQAGVVLGSADFAKRLARGIKGVGRERRAIQGLKPGVTWEQIIQGLEVVKKERREAFRDQHGDWGRDAALWLGRREGRLKLKRLGELAGGMDYAAVGAAISRWDRRMAKDRRWAKIIAQVRNRISNVKN